MMLYILFKTHHSDLVPRYKPLLKRRNGLKHNHYSVHFSKKSYVLTPQKARRSGHVY